MGKRGRKPTYDLSNEACPNPQCELFGKQGQGNIVSNGSHRGPNGQRIRKLLCRQCRGSFCERSGSIFYDLRSPEEKVLMALKLLVKGMPLRGVAEVMEVKLDTVRHWLRVAAEHSEQVNALLLKELKVTQVELDALWSFVKKNDLRHRANLWREKSGSGLPWPRSIG
jgi:transposase-like protein